jgi:hypothetical protein
MVCAGTPVFPPAPGRRLHLCALSPEGYGAGSAVQRASVHARACMLWSYPREINQVLLRSLCEFDELVGEDHLIGQP